MVSFDFLPSLQNKKLPVILPLFAENLKKLSPQNLQGLTAEQKQAVQKAAGSKNLPKAGSVAIFETAAPVIIELLGKNEKFGKREALEAGERMMKIAERYQLEEFALLPGGFAKNLLVPFWEGVALGTYQFTVWKGKKFHEKKKKETNVRQIYLFGAKDNAITKRLEIINEAVKLTKDLVNDPPHKATPTWLVSVAKDFAKKLPKVSVKILGEKELAKLGCGGLIAVGQGSDEESRLIILEYKGGKKEAPIALIGKGVTYDTGGLSLKPAQYMVTMKQDLGGAATVMGAFWAIAKSGVKKNVLAVIPTAENLINHQAYKPDDILTMYNGVTVEVTNTDAEGRLILADALAYTEEKYKPRAMVDLATLTGACEYAVGDDYSAILGADRKLLAALFKAAENVQEPIWELPFHERYQKYLESPVADIVNSSRKLKAGTIEGALFLNNFVSPKMPWCHMDIASVAFDDKNGFATGRNVRLLWDFVENY